MWRSRAGCSGPALATILIATALLISSTETGNAGIFSWLSGRNDRGLENQAPPGNPGPFNWQRGNRPPNSGSRVDGDGSPPTDNDAAIREWITNPALGSPTHATRNIESTKGAIERYKLIVAQGGWPTVPAVVMRPGKRGPEIVTLHRRLEVSGDLVGVSVPDTYDAAVVQAVKNFQRRHGLPPTGVIDTKATVEALNVPASVRLAQLRAGLQRLKTKAPSAASRYVLVNIPAAQIEAVENGKVVSRHAAVVGKVDRQSPELSSKIQEINFNPYWYVPRSIIHKDLVPKGREFARNGQDMLAAYQMEAFDESGQRLSPREIDWFGTDVYNYRFRQLPWEENSLGFVKINFPNNDAVYMHDTPLKSLFGRTIRFESSGCVRVDNVERLVAWIMRDTPGWDINRIVAMKRSGERLDVKLDKSVPVYWVYISGWATPDGQVHFRPDIYNLDGPAETASSR